MADELPTPTAPAPTAAPIEAAPAPAIVETAPVVATPEPATVAAPDAHAEPAKPFNQADAPSLLMEVGKKPEAVADPAKPSEPARETAPEAAPVSYDFKFPDGVELVKPDVLADVTNLFREKNIPPDVAQTLMDRHVAEMTAYQEHVKATTLENQHRAFAEYRQQMLQETMSDPEIGGAGHDAAMQEIAALRDRIWTKDELSAGGPLDTFLRTTGSGESRILLVGLHRMAKLLNEPKPSYVMSKPVADRGGAGRANRLDVLYDKPMG